MQDLLGHAWALIAFTLHIVVALRALTRPNRAPASRIAWIAVIMLAPLLGMIAYLLLGETSVGRARAERWIQTVKTIRLPRDECFVPRQVSPRTASLFMLGRAISGLQWVGGNRIVLLTDPDASADDPVRHSHYAIEAMLADIAQAREHVHLAVYIWLADRTGMRMAEAIAAAARRGVACRVMADALGSYAFTHSPAWTMMADAGVQMEATLSDIKRWRHVAFSRADLRDHRKLLVIDNRIAYCGSQNCADPEFHVKARFAPWVDLMLRCQGPVVRQMQALFLSGWIPESGEVGLEQLAAQQVDDVFGRACVAQMFETGPVVADNALADMFVACIHAARVELVITTPYFVPDESILRAICAAPRRGVRTVLILPARNDSLFVGLASRSTYPYLLQNGVELYEYTAGLLHAKSMTIDGRLSLVGSANMDRRSLELNYENNLLIADREVTASIRERQAEYLRNARPVSLASVQTWPFHRRLVQNVVGMMAPVL